MTYKKHILFIGDIHGRAEWRELTLNALKNFEEVILLGDYVDSYDIRPVSQLENLKAIITFIRKKSKGRVTALFGNHDYAYYKGKFAISGFQSAMYQDFRKIFEDNSDIFQIAWGHTNKNGKYTLVTHAGLTKRFWDKYVVPKIKEDSPTEMHEILNSLKDDDEIMWKVGDYRGGIGTPGPLWADIHELENDPYPNINQVVGHTAYYTPTIAIHDDIFIARIDSWDGLKTASLQISL